MNAFPICSKEKRRTSGDDRVALSLISSDDALRVRQYQSEYETSTEASDKPSRNRFALR